MRRMLGLFLSVVLTYTAFACSPCNHTGMSITAHVAQSAANDSTAAQTMVEVRGTGFTPNTMVTISFEKLPSTPRDGNKFSDTSAVSDPEGTFIWTKDISAFPPVDHSFNSNADVMVTAKEVYVHCTAKTTIKTGDMINAPAK